MPRIPDTELERLKNEVSVERLVEASGVELKKAGKDMLGRCPFHDDAEASLVVTAAKNLWHCFGCQVGGGPIDWVGVGSGSGLSPNLPTHVPPPPHRVPRRRLSHHLAR